MKKKLKIFDHSWHIAHQCDMLEALEEYCDFFFCINATKPWPDDIPTPPNLSFVTHYEPGKYDCCILHIDQRAFFSWREDTAVYREFNELITDIPKIVINHGTPVLPWTKNSLDSQKKNVHSIKKIIGDNTMVVNSHRAASIKEWGFGVPIVHGMNPHNWSDLVKEHQIFTALSPFGMNEYYNRDCLESVKYELEIRHHMLWHAKVNIETDISKEIYKKFLGSSLIYLDTSIRTPMNRARTEAMLSGCCVVQVEGAHDLDRWARPGENIVIVPNDPAVIAETIVDLVENKYLEAVQIGQRGKKMAIENFSPERFRQSWLELLAQKTNTVLI